MQFVWTSLWNLKFCHVHTPSVGKGKLWSLIGPINMIKGGKNIECQVQIFGNVDFKIRVSDVNQGGGPFSV